MSEQDVADLDDLRSWQKSKDAKLTRLRSENERLAKEWQQCHDWNAKLVKEHYTLTAVCEAAKEYLVAKENWENCRRNQVAEFEFGRYKEYHAKEIALRTALSVWEKP